jgi:hypothetical protein
MQVIAIDLDKTASFFPSKVNALYEDPNNFIVIYTARSNSIRDQTLTELKEKGIKYHALVMDKLRADIYIDDKNQGGLQWPT